MHDNLMRSKRGPDWSKIFYLNQIHSGCDGNPTTHMCGPAIYERADIDSKFVRLLEISHFGSEFFLDFVKIRIV